MKVLWFTDTPSLYKKENATYNGSGWIESLEKIFSKKENIDLGICFFHNDNCFKVKTENATYYPVSLYNSKSKRILHNLNYKKSSNIEVKSFLKVISDFKPDIIHVFGSEKSFGLITYHIQIPVVIHIQGILNPYLNAYYPPGINNFDILKSLLFKPLSLINALKVHHFFSTNALRERLIVKNCRNFIGRTDWDKSVNLLLAREANYYYCSEALRNEFYISPQWTLKNNTILKFVTTISKVPYKGLDLILKTALLLKQTTDIEFEWNVFGVDNYSFWENKFKVTFESVNIKLKGNINAAGLAYEMNTADLYIHPSYIDNSPNSVCEAQLLGLPVIATYVGGVPTLIENNITGILVPANDPYYLAAKIKLLSIDKNLCVKLGENGRKVAILRHDREKIFKDLFSIYNSIIYNN